MNDLLGVRMIHLGTGDVHRIISRKRDDTGWWVEGGGGLSDSVIEGGDWVPLAWVLAHYKGDLSGRLPEPCNGEYRCRASVHVHGCYADRGACDSPEEHADSGSRGGSDV